MEKIKIIVIGSDGTQTEKEVYKVFDTKDDLTNFTRDKLSNKEKQIAELNNKLESEKIARKDNTLTSKLKELGIKESLIEVAKKAINPDYEKEGWDDEIRKFVDKHKEFSVIEATIPENMNDDKSKPPDIKEKTEVDIALEKYKSGIIR